MTECFKLVTRLPYGRSGLDGIGASASTRASSQFGDLWPAEANASTIH